LRVCVACRQFKARQELVRLTCDHVTRNVLVNCQGSIFASPEMSALSAYAGELLAKGLAGKPFGRSAYVCFTLECIGQLASKNQKNRNQSGRLIGALSGRSRKSKGAASGESLSRRCSLEPQIIEQLLHFCTDSAQTCQNTQG
jgi:predicted RNA-binding protein YlxR (DUF448 family)